MFTTSKIATTTLLALTLSMGLSACSPAQNENVPSASATASATSGAVTSPTASADVSKDASATDSAVPTPSSEASDSSDANEFGKTAESANERINDFMATIKSETLPLAADPAAMAASKEPGGFNKAFANSIAFIDTDKFSDDKIVSIVGGFAAIYLADNNATIVSKDADSMIVSGDNAVIDGNAFTITLNGKEMKGKAGSGGSLVMTFVDGEWKITGFVNAPSSK